MGAVNRASEEARQPELDVPDMVDILYELIAFGVDNDSQVPLDQVQQFLHEHARAPKSEVEFRRFFAEHTIEARAIHDPPLPLEGLSAPIPPLDDELTPLPSISRVRPLTPIAQTLTTTASPAPAPSPAPSMRPLLVFGGLLLVALVGLSVFGVTTVRQLRTQLSAAQHAAEQERLLGLARQQQAELAQRELAAQEDRVEHLRTQNAALQRAVDALVEAQEAADAEEATRRRRARARARRSVVSEP